MVDDGPPLDQMDVVAFPFHDQRKSDRQGVRTRDGHLLDRFARDRRVRRLLVVDRPVSLAERVIRRHDRTAGGRPVETWSRAGLTSTITEARSGAFVLDISVRDVVQPILRPRRWWFRVFESRDVIATVQEALQRLTITDPAGIAWTPTGAAPVAAIQWRSLVFDSLDNWLIHPVLRREAEAATAAYARMLPISSSVVASAEASAAILQRWAPSVEIIPNGVDPERFRAPSERADDLPVGPIVGYAGKLGRRIDTGLVEAVADLLPAVTFLFVGPQLDASTRSLGRRSNIRLLGDRHPDVLPRYVSAFDIAWIPHRVGDGESGGDPIKLYEYVAARRPILTSKIDGWRGWTSLAMPFESAAEAAAIIESILAGRANPPSGDVPRDRTWSHISGRMIDLLNPTALGSSGRRSSRATSGR